MNVQTSIEIAAPVLIRESGQIRVRYVLRGLPQPYLEYTIDAEYEDFLSERSDAALIALIVPAMAAGKNLIFRGAISARLLHNTRMDLMRLLCSVIEGLRPIQIQSDIASSPEPGCANPAVLTGLSNGVDSLSTVAEYLLNPEAAPELRPTHFLFNDVGNQGRLENSDSQQLFMRKIAHVRASAAHFGLPVLTVQSNLDGFFQTTFPQTHTLRNASVAFLLQRRTRHFLYGSGVPYHNVHGGKSRDIAYADPILLPLISTPSLQCHSSGAGHTRTAKTAIVAEMASAHELLHVCVREHENCSVCWKCARTMLTLDVLGKLDGFAPVFDIEKFQGIRSAFISHTIGCRNRDPLSKEILGLMRQHGCRPSLKEQMSGALTRVVLSLSTALPMSIQRLGARLAGFSDSATLTQGMNPSRLWTLKLKIRQMLAGKKAAGK